LFLLEWFNLFYGNVGLRYLEMQVLADGRWPSSAGRIVTDGMGWKPSSEAGSAGEPGITTAHVNACQATRLPTYEQEHAFALRLSKACDL
jgi:hypothetical protein